MKIVTVEEMRGLEAAAFASGITERELQLRAGAAVAEEVFRANPAKGRVVVLVGHGNNGRDGAVAAEWLLHHDTQVDLVLAPRHAVKSEELVRLRAAGAATIPSSDVRAVDAVLDGAAVALDALAGIGARGALREPLASLAERLNAYRARLRVIALDLPSGIDADTGDVPGEAVLADATVTLGGVKQGLLRFPAADRVGRLIPREIGIPATADEGLAYAVLEEPTLRTLVPRRALEAHKYRFGRVLVLAGSDHFLGAAVLCAGAAARVGAGLVTVGSTHDVRLNVAAHVPEATFTQVDVRAADGVSAARALETYLQSHNVIVIGPGLGRGPEVTRFVAEVLKLRARQHAMVVDADGLFALAEMDDWSTLLGPNVVLTPHAGELSRLVGHDLDRAEPEWVRAARLAGQWRCVVAAKGPFTCVASPEGSVGVWTRANPALATGGTGDVLAGLTAGLLGQGLSTWDATRMAVGLHGLAATRITDSRHWRTLLASDLLHEVPGVLGELTTRPQ